MWRRGMPRGLLRTVYELFNFFMNRHLLQVGIEFLQLQTLGVVLFVLFGDITAGTRHTGVFFARCIPE